MTVRSQPARLLGQAVPLTGGPQLVTPGNADGVGGYMEMLDTHLALTNLGGRILRMTK